MSNSFINLTKNMENEKKMGGGQVGPIWSSNFSLNSAACMKKRVDTESQIIIKKTHAHTHKSLYFV